MARFVSTLLFHSSSPRGTVPTVCHLPRTLFQCSLRRQPKRRGCLRARPPSMIGGHCHLPKKEGFAPVPSSPRGPDGNDLSFLLALIVDRCPIARKTVRANGDTTKHRFTSSDYTCIRNRFRDVQHLGTVFSSPADDFTHFSGAACRRRIG